MVEQPNDGFLYFYLDGVLCRAWPVSIGESETNLEMQTFSVKINWDWEPL